MPPVAVQIVGATRSASVPRAAEAACLVRKRDARAASLSRGIGRRSPSAGVHSVDAKLVRHQILHVQRAATSRSWDE